MYVLKRTRKPITFPVTASKYLYDDKGEAVDVQEVTLYTVKFASPGTPEILAMRPLVASLEAESARYATALNRFKLGVEEERPSMPDIEGIEDALRGKLADLLMSVEGLANEEGEALSLEDLGDDGIEAMLAEWEVDVLCNAARMLIQAKSLPRVVGNG